MTLRYLTLAVQFTPKKITMKIIRLSTLALVLAGLSSFAIAGPGPQSWQTLRSETQFKQLKSEDKVVYVCSQCKTVSEITPAQAMDHCKEGATLTCPSCKTKVKVTLKRQRNDPPTKSEIVYVNDKGEECAFIAVVAANK